MSSRNPRFLRALGVLRASSHAPAVFRNLLARISLSKLDQPDIDAAWALAVDLSRRDDVEGQCCSDLLSAWCTRQLLKRISEKCIDG